MASSAYQRTVSSDDGRGFRYETKMTALTALRLYKTSNEFYLANNFAKADKFDDIVFTANLDGKWQTWFIQLKQKQASTLLSKKISVSALRSKGDFVLKKYFESFSAIRNKFKVGAKDIVFSKKFEDAKFLIYTNAHLHDIMLNRNLERVPLKLLETNPDDGVNIKFNYLTNVDIFLGMQPNEKLFNFLDNFWFCSRQANEEDMDLIIQKEIREIAKVDSDVEVKYFTQQLCNFIYSWCKTGEYLTKTHVSNLLSKTTIETQSGKKDDSPLEFIPSFIKYSFGNLKNDKLVLYSSKAENCLLCMTMLKQSGIFNDPNKLLTLKQIDNNEIQGIVFDEWSSKDIVRDLILDCEGDNVSIDKGNISNFIKKLKSSNHKNRIIMVATKHNIFANEMAQLVSAKTFAFNCSLINVTESSKQLLMNCEVLFQGYKAKLSSVMSTSKRSLDDVFSMTSLTQLLQGRLISVGIKPIEPIPYYVTRVLTRQSAVSPNLFADPQINACFALSGISLEAAISSLPCASSIASSLNILTSHDAVTAKIIVLEGDPSTDFEEISRKVSKPFHWFEKSKKGSKMWHWKKSTRCIEDISKYIESALDYVATDNIMEIKDKVVVVTAEPGMGKSTLLNHLAAETKRICPYIWVLSLVLNDNTDFLDSEDFVRNAEVNTKTILAAAAKVDKGTSKFDARLFEECYNSGNMIVLLDGFDEIVPYYTAQGLALINTLRKSPVSRIWISARPVLRELLEHETFTLSYTIKPFELKDQKNFLAKYWQTQMPGISKVKLDTFIINVLDLIEKSFDEKLHQFTGIPLQTRMLAEVFYPDLKKYHEIENFTLKERLNGVQLFEKFVAIKRGIQLEKAKITVTNAMARYDQRRLDEARELDLMYLALLTLLPRSKCEKLQPGVSAQKAKELKKYVTDGHEKTGIVMSFKGDIPQFIHRTFAEYFTALYFTKNFATNRAFLSSDDFLAETFEFVKYFFDRILAAEQELHEAVLGQDTEEVEALLGRSINVDALDKGGRTALHIAAAMPRSRSTIMLIQAGAKVELADGVLGWNPMTYAVKLGGIENICPILELTQQRLEANVIPITWESLLTAVQGDYLQTLLYLIENDVYSVESLDELSSQKWINNSISSGLTILHLAAAYDSVKILDHLLQKKSRDSKLRLIELKDANGLTPLLLAASMGRVNAVNCLLRAGANSLTSSPDGKNLIQYAAASRSLEMFESAVKIAHNSNVSAEAFLPMTITTLIGDKTEWSSHAVQLLLSLYPNLVNIKTPKGVPLLIFASMKGNELAVQRLCELGADVNVMDVYGTPLHFAVAGGHEEIVRYLLDRPNIQINARDAEGCTPLLKSVCKGNVNLCDMLIEAGSDVHIVTKNGSDLTHAVAVSCCEPIFYYLLELGFDFKKQNHQGETALSMLQAAGALSMVNKILPPPPPETIMLDLKTETTNEIPIAAKPRRKKKSVSQKEGSAEPAENKIIPPKQCKKDNVPKNKTPKVLVHPVNNGQSIPLTPGKENKQLPDNLLQQKKAKKQPPKKKQPPNAPQAPTIHNPDAFLSILKDLKGFGSPQVDAVAEQLKSFIDLGKTTNTKKPPRNRKNKNPQPGVVQGPKGNNPSVQNNAQPQKKAEKKSSVGINESLNGSTELPKQKGPTAQPKAAKPANTKPKPSKKTNEEKKAVVPSK